MARLRRRRIDPRTAEIAVGTIARYDAGRLARTGVPEVILAEGKQPDHVLQILRALHAEGRSALVSRLTPSVRRQLARAGSNGLGVELQAGGRIATLGAPRPRLTGVGPAAILTAGTADLGVADEAAAVLVFGGARVLRANDVGVAGLHRLTRALATIERTRPSVYLVCAGREGALPTVVAGLVRSPVVGIPTSVGYGRGGRGEAALTAMLQSCAPIAVVNIDGGVPAALFALQLLRRQSQRDGS